MKSAVTITLFMVHFLGVDKEKELPLQVFSGAAL
jgi:hypothetical protein